MVNVSNPMSASKNSISSYYYYNILFIIMTWVKTFWSLVVSQVGQEKIAVSVYQCQDVLMDIVKIHLILAYVKKAGKVSYVTNLFVSKYLGF